LLANSLSIKDTKPLVKTKSSVLYKIIVYVPKDYLSDVKQALYNAGAGHIGNYSNCSFETVGKGQFKPLEESNPFSDEKNEISVIKEMKIEVILHEEKVSEAIINVLNAHLYEEVAYDIYK